jgi:hypothetical protein
LGSGEIEKGKFWFLLRIRVGIKEITVSNKIASNLYINNYVSICSRLFHKHWPNISRSICEFIHLVSNRFRGFFRFMFKSMNRVLDGMLGFGGVMVAASFEFIGSSHRNDRWRRF